MVVMGMSMGVVWVVRVVRFARVMRVVRVAWVVRVALVVMAVAVVMAARAVMAATDVSSVMVMWITASIGMLILTVALVVVSVRTMHRSTPSAMMVVIN